MEKTIVLTRAEAATLERVLSRILECCEIVYNETGFVVKKPKLKLGRGEKQDLEIIREAVL